MLRKWLEELGTKLSDSVSQNDIVYAFGDWESNQSTSGRNILRIRQEDGRAPLTLKRPGIKFLKSGKLASITPVLLQGSDILQIGTSKKSSAVIRSSAC